MNAALSELMRLHAEAGSHYFSPATLAFFGTARQRALRLPDGRWLYSEYQGAAPEGHPRWRAVVFAPDGVERLGDETSWSRGQAMSRVMIAVTS